MPLDTSTPKFQKAVIIIIIISECVHVGTVCQKAYNLCWSKKDHFNLT